MRARLAVPDQRARIKAAVVENLRVERGGGDAKNVVIVSCDFEAPVAGQTLADLTKARNAEPTLENAADTALQLEERGDCAAVYHAISEDDVARIMCSPFTMIVGPTASSLCPATARPHPRSYGTFARVLEHRRAREKDADSGAGGAQDVRLPCPAAEALGSREPASDDEGRHHRVRSLRWMTGPNSTDRHRVPVGVRDVIVNGRFVLRSGAVTDRAAGPGALRSSAQMTT